MGYIQYKINKWWCLVHRDEQFVWQLYKLVKTTKNIGQLLTPLYSNSKGNEKKSLTRLVEISYVFSHKINIVAEASITHFFCKYEIGKPIFYPLYVPSNIEPKWLFIILNKFFFNEIHDNKTWSSFQFISLSFNFDSRFFFFLRTLVCRLLLPLFL